MGYTTEFKGVLKFKSEPTTKELASLNKLFRDEDLQLELAEDFSGIQWDVLVIGIDGAAIKQTCDLDSDLLYLLHCDEKFNVETHRLECVTANHSKFWEVFVIGNSVLTRWGKIGTKGQQPAEAATFRDESAAMAQAAKQIKNKLSKKDPDECYAQIY